MSLEDNLLPVREKQQFSIDRYSDQMLKGLRGLQLVNVAR